eukprot:jgi/Mesen1/964/ME000012S00515
MSPGIGLALAREFLKAGDRVLICSRTGERVDQTVKELGETYGKDKVAGTVCNVADAKSVKELADFAKTSFGHVDLWAIILMREQSRGGHIFNMDGAGADGNATPRFAAYGATKRSLAQFTKSLQAELKMLQVKNVTVHNLSPGMVTTDLLMSGSDTRVAKFFINALAESANTVAEYLVPRMRLVPGGGSRSTYIRFLTGPKAYSQILARVLFKARKDRYVPEE